MALPVKDYIKYNRNGKVQVVVESLEELAAVPNVFKFVTLVQNGQAKTFKYDSGLAHSAHDGVNIIADNKEYGADWNTPPTDGGTGCYVYVSPDTRPVYSFTINNNDDLDDALIAYNSNSTPSKYIFEIPAGVSIDYGVIDFSRADHHVLIQGQGSLRFTYLNYSGQYPVNITSDLKITISKLICTNSIVAYTSGKVSINTPLCVSTDFVGGSFTGNSETFIASIKNEAGDDYPVNSSGNVGVGTAFFNRCKNVFISGGLFENVRFTRSKGTGNVVGSHISEYLDHSEISTYYHNVQMDDLVRYVKDYGGQTIFRHVRVYQNSTLNFYLRDVDYEKLRDFAEFFHIDVRRFSKAVFKWTTLNPDSANGKVKVSEIKSEQHSETVFMLCDYSGSSVENGTDKGYDLQVGTAWGITGSGLTIFTPNASNDPEITTSSNDSYSGYVRLVRSGTGTVGDLDKIL